ncbi:hypothetical protein [uncultured Marinobacter sp.]|uniref:hypothetical protein n=1 Tax=uncultured Marinobacter sp. TaxID=187379 RepID=UPI0030D97649|tara:strand:+ start:99 stop:635 length:537 start_codon:yes stop_codon:yes gene_type:complete
MKTEIANEFSRILRSWLTPDVMENVIDLNQSEDDSHVCHSHDFCDANEAMSAAFERAVGRPSWLPSQVDEGLCTDVDVTTDMDLWNSAWDIAKDTAFTPAVTTTCPCGSCLPVPIVDHGFDVCGVECPDCGRMSTGGNGRTGIVDGWITAKSAAQSQAAFEAQQFDVDMNEWYGRGNW